MNKHRIIPLAFTLTFALLLPLLALGGPVSRPAAPSAGLMMFLTRMDRNAANAWNQWHEKNEKYAELVRLDQR